MSEQRDLQPLKRQVLDTLMRGPVGEEWISVFFDTLRTGDIHTVLHDLFTQHLIQHGEAHTIEITDAGRRWLESQT